MTTTTLFSNKSRLSALIAQDFRKVKLLTVLYTVVSFVFLPLQYILSVMSRINLPNGLSTLYFVGATKIYTVGVIGFCIVTGAYALIIAGQLMDYNYNKRAVDVYYAMPFTRRQVMLSHIITGGGALVVPIWLNYGITAAMQAIYLPAQLDVMLVIRDALLWSAVILFIFLSTLLVGCFMGNMGDTILFTLGVNCTIPFVYLMLEFMLSFMVAGWGNSDASLRIFLHTHIGMIAPMVMITESIAISEVNFTVLGLWVLMLPVLAFGAVEAYAKRDAELAESIGKDNWLRIIEKIVGIFLGSNLFALMIMMVLGTFDNLIYPDIASIWEYVPALIFGGILVYVIIEVVLARGFKTVKTNLWICGVGTSAAFMLVAVVGTGLFGFENVVPSPADVDSVTIYDRNDNYGKSNLYYGMRDSGITFVQKENIAKLTETHKSVIGDIKYLRETDIADRKYVYDPFTITYTLKNGSKITREYTKIGFGSAEMLGDVEGSAEGSTQINRIFCLEPKSVSSLSVQNSTGSDAVDIAGASEAQIQALVQAIRDDSYANLDVDKSYTGLPAYYVNFTFDADYYKNLKKAEKLAKAEAASSYNDTAAEPTETRAAAQYESLREPSDMSGNTRTIQILIPTSYSKSIAAIEAILPNPLKNGDIADVTGMKLGFEWSGRYYNAQDGRYIYGESQTNIPVVNFYGEKDSNTDIDIPYDEELVKLAIDNTSSRMKVARTINGNAMGTDDMIISVRFLMPNNGPLTYEEGYGFTRFVTFGEATTELQDAAIKGAALSGTYRANMMLNYLEAMAENPQTADKARAVMERNPEAIAAMRENRKVTEKYGDIVA